MTDTDNPSVDGEWIEPESGDTFEVTNPADTTT